jgi:hypothetical protein
MQPAISDAYRARLALARKLKLAARELDPPPAPEATNAVDLCGEELSRPIYWQGRQWAVTGYGVERRDGRYAIDATRLWEQDESYGWVRHMAGKKWVDLRTSPKRCGLRDGVAGMLRSGDRTQLKADAETLGNSRACATGLLGNFRRRYPGDASAPLYWGNPQYKPRQI